MNSQVSATGTMPVLLTSGSAWLVRFLGPEQASCSGSALTSTTTGMRTPTEGTRGASQLLHAVNTDTVCDQQPRPSCDTSAHSAQANNVAGPALCLRLSSCGTTPSGQATDGLIVLAVAASSGPEEQGSPAGYVDTSVPADAASALVRATLEAHVATPPHPPATTGAPVPVGAPVPLASQEPRALPVPVAGSEPVVLPGSVIILEPAAPAAPEPYPASAAPELIPADPAAPTPYSAPAAPIFISGALCDQMPGSIKIEFVQGPAPEFIPAQAAGPEFIPAQAAGPEYIPAQAAGPEFIQGPPAPQYLTAPPNPQAFQTPLPPQVLPQPLGAAPEDNENEWVLVAKTLTRSDAGTRRIILPRISVETNMPEVAAWGYWSFQVTDEAGRYWEFVVRAWSNGHNPKPVYVLEHISDFLRQWDVKEGDSLGLIRRGEQYSVEINTERVRALVNSNNPMYSPRGFGNGVVGVYGPPGVNGMTRPCMRTAGCTKPGGHAGWCVGHRGFKRKNMSSDCGNTEDSYRNPPFAPRLKRLPKYPDPRLTWPGAYPPLPMSLDPAFNPNLTYLNGPADYSLPMDTPGVGSLQQLGVQEQQFGGQQHFGGQQQQEFGGQQPLPQQQLQPPRELMQPRHPAQQQQLRQQQQLQPQPLLQQRHHQLQSQPQQLTVNGQVHIVLNGPAEQQQVQYAQNDQASYQPVFLQNINRNTSVSASVPQVQENVVGYGGQQQPQRMSIIQQLALNHGQQAGTLLA